MSYLDDCSIDLIHGQRAQSVAVVVWFQVVAQRLALVGSLAHIAF
jgi:hypothetical protein